MAERRQLLIEVDRTFKLIAEGLDSFDEKLEAMKAAPNKQQKEKHMAELKEELKKLQRYRAKVMSWATCKEVKDKRAVFEDQRLIIETRMETYREMERADKTKPFSEKALEAEPKIDPVQRDHEEVFQWLRQTISVLQTQTEPWEAELERLTAESGGGRTILAKIEDLRLRISQNQQHVAKLELIMRYLHNDNIEFQDVKDLRETVEAYAESQRESRCAVDVDYLDIYDDVLESVRENDQLLLLPLAQSQVPGALNTATSIEDLEEETHEIHCRPPVTPTELSPSPFPAQPNKRSTVPIPNYAIEDHGGSHSHHKTLPKSANLSHQNVVVPAPVPPPLSVPYSRVAAAKIHQQAEAEYFEIYNEAMAAAAACSPVDAISSPRLSSAETSEEETSERSNSPDRKQTSPLIDSPVSVSPTRKRNTSPADPIIDDRNDDFCKMPPAMADLKISIDGNYSSTEDVLSLICDPEKLNLISHQTMLADSPVSDRGDQEAKKAFGGRATPFSSRVGSAPVPIEIPTQSKMVAPISITSGYVGDRACVQNGSGVKPSTVAAPLPSSCGTTPVAPPSTRISKLPYAFNGTVRDGGSDADETFRNKEEVLKSLDAASKRLPHPDNSMRSGHRRLWRDQNFQGSFNPNYPIQQSCNFCGVDFGSRLYYTLLADETLMFVFYHLQGTLAHRCAIECLEERGWMWHTQRTQWFKHESADSTALRQQLESLNKKNGFVAGSFKYFDFEKWEERLAPDFVFRLEYWKTLYNWENSGQRRPMVWTK